MQLHIDILTKRRINFFFVKHNLLLLTTTLKSRALILSHNSRYFKYINKMLFKYQSGCI